jgi:uncharacterized 2Fe-2S/4Fe-4S cluster protein (DUF4445 family)
MGDTVQIIFLPFNRVTKVERGTTLLEAIRLAGLQVESICGGKGECGKCRVIVPDKNAVTEITEDENKHLSLEEIGLGYRLACRTILKKSARVVVPEESRILARKIQMSGLEMPLRPKPFVKKGLFQLYFMA